MNKDVRVDGILVHSDAFPSEPVESLAEVLRRPTLVMLDKGQRLACERIRGVAVEYEVLHGQRPGCITYFDGVAIAWHYNPYSRF